MDLTIQQVEALRGEINPLRDYCITLGMSNGSRGVMFVLYSILKNSDCKYINPFNYLGILGGDIDTAIKNARKRIPRFELKVDTTETFRTRTAPNTMPFGKYKGMTIDEIFDQDEKYLFWLSGSDSLGYIKSETTRNNIIQYGEIAKENIVNSNRESSLPALPIEDKAIERTLTVYSKKIETIEVSYGYSGVDTVYVAKMKDSDGNKFYYKGGSSVFGKLFDPEYLNLKEIEITVKCRVISNFESMGVMFNKIKLR